MNKYRNYVYLTICEITIERFMNSGYVDYSNYCKSLFSSCKMGLLTKREKSDVIAIYKRVEMIYSMGNRETGKYIADYLNCGRYEEFRECVLMTQRFFPNSSDFNK